MQIISKLKQNKSFLLLCLCYFFFRFLFLLRLPIFNDEGIYLDWGWRELHGAGLFYSLYDAKQPLLMWFFGIFELLFPDPLFAGRFVSVLSGFLTMLGLYKLGKTLWNEQTAYAVSILYIVTPIFSFFDRQALMESAVSAIGVWACYFIIKLTDEITQSRAIALGCILGIGLLVKSTVLLFIFTTCLLLPFLLLRKETKQTMYKTMSLVVCSLIAVDLILLIQPQFWSTLSSNDRFTFSIPELLHFPFLQWIQNAIADSTISFFYLTPFVLLAGIAGIIIGIKQKKITVLICVLWLFINLLIEVVVTRSVSQRYLVSFLPMILLFTGYFSMQYFKRWHIAVLGLVLIIPLCMTLLQLFLPATYILSLDKIEPFAQLEYIKGTTSGYGIETARTFLQTQSHIHPIFVGISENSGNPESALQTYYAKNSSVSVVYFDKQILGDSVDQFDCIAVQHPLFFISRDEQQAGLNKFFRKIRTIKNPHGTNSIGIYTLKQDCKGKVGYLQLSTEN